MKKNFLILLLLVILGLGWLCSNPLISYKTEVSAEYSWAIESQAKGVYSHRLPLVPVYISVERVEGETVFYTIHYFPFGTVGMSYTANDGYNIEKELSRI